MPAPTGDARRVNLHLLNAMRNEVLRVLTPELKSDYAKLSADWLCTAIDSLLLAEHDDAATAAAREALLAKLPPTPVAGDYLPEAGDTAQAIPRIAAGVRAMGAATPAGTQHAIAELTGNAIRSQNKFLQAQRETSMRALEAVDIAVTPDRLDRYFDASLFAGHRTRHIVQMTGGYSKDTFLIETAAPDGSRRDIVIRRDLPFGPVEGSAVEELPYLEKLDALGIPVPRPIVAERDRQFLGWPFLVTERIPGAPAEAALAADKAAGEQGARQLARILARLHSIGPRDLGLTVDAAGPRAQVASYVDYWRRRWQRYRCVESDLMEAAFAWLDAHMPREVSRSVPVHGDYRPGNALWHEGRISGMVDWEYLHAGDAAEDVEYARLFVGQLLDPAEFMAEYLAAGGVDYDPANADFYEVFRSVRNVVCIDTAWHGFLHGHYPSLKPAFTAYHLRRLVMGFLADGLRRVTRGAVPEA